MNIEITVKREGKYSGTNYELITLDSSDLEQLAISKCKDMFNDNEENCTFEAYDMEINTN